LGLCLIGAATGGYAGQKRQTAVAVPAGTAIEVRLDNQLDTGETQTGQTFTGTVTQPVVVGGKTVLAKGATVKGQVTEVVSSGRLKRPASITLVLSTVSTQPLKIDGKSHVLRNVALIGGGAAAGAAVGGVTGGKKGAAIGTAIGAGAGTATAFLTGKQEIVLPAETVLPFVAGSGAAAAPAAAARSDVAHAAARAPAEAHAPEPAGGLGQAVQAVFTNRDQEIIRNYYSGGRGLPPGLAKKGKLPPGLAKQLRRNGSLPPGLQKKYGAVPFPPELVRQLPPVPSGYSRLLIAGRAVLTDRNHNILDLMAVIQ
jgi:hypothetical protein